ncbi:MAG TPA: isoprenoid biosynthesis glyoxalase ElbB [Thermoanaerobaculaceae bacterium]|nr:isoprenoid biosynthesis glyoxalase ElbB [Thermoanaerobaculaceae bacterium]HRS15346.1 isoprenoid biosynthesis glyoxalase ElbB [Thermoanaerobaculaceae bacterium]
MSRPRIGVLLAGCGVYDGAEIHEAVVTLLALDREGAEAVCLAPSVAQYHVVNHLTGQPMPGAQRNVLEEAARIARGAVRDVAGVAASELDALVIPGGFGAAKNLCSFAFEGANCSVQPAVESLVRALHEAGKPIGAMCIAPAILARVLGPLQPRLTIGTDAATAAALESMGARHVPCAVDDIVVDETARVVSTPAYMLAGRIGEAAAGIEKLVAAVVRMARG